MKPRLQRTIPQIFEQSVQQYPQNILLWEKRTDAYEGTTYTEIHDRVLLCASGLMGIGINKGDRIALISEGRNDRVVSELGILYAGAINVPISVKLDELTDLKFRIAHSGCKMIIISGGHVHKIRAIYGDLPELEKVIILDGDPSVDSELKFSTLLDIGSEFLKSRRAEFDLRWTGVTENDPANICYTSGTTADPKGIILRMSSKPPDYCRYRKNIVRY